MMSVDVRSLVPLPALSGQELAGTQLTVGEVIRARVIESGAQGQPVLMLGGATMAMQLPFPVTPGQSLDFTVLEVKPEVRLGVARQTDTSGSPVPPDAGPDLQISPEGRLLSRAERSLQPPDAPPTLRVPGSGTDALLRDPTLLSVALRQSVEHSGLFYERHLAQWVSGQRSEEALRQEPQAAWPRRQMAGLPLADAPDLGARLAQAGLGEEAIGMIRQQVDVLQQQGLVMRSEVAPGQVVDWRTRVEDEGRRRDGADAESRRWETELNSDFGSLSRVQARLGLTGDRLQISLRGSPETLARMQAWRDDLEGALVAAGLQLEALRFESLASETPVVEPGPVTVPSAASTVTAASAATTPTSSTGSG